MLDQIHVSLECRTFSLMAQAHNGRCIDNHFMGLSEDAYEANVSLAHAVALCVLPKRANPMMLCGWENSNANLRLHPIMRLMERSEQEGGLDRLLVSLRLLYMYIGSEQEGGLYWPLGEVARVGRGTGQPC
jgi:hypothetical protein